MDRDRLEGAARTLAGRIKGWFGSLLGDSKLQARGKADETAGRIQNTVGGVKDTLRDDR